LMRVPQEDFCQALGVAPALKYESDGGPGVAASFALLRRSRDADADRRTFFRALVVFWLLAAIDGHAKNFSLFLLPGGRCRMTPIYDVLSAHPIVAKGELARQKLKMAMAVVGTDRHYKWTSIRPRHWLTTAAHVDLLESDAREVLHDVLARGPRALADVRTQLPHTFPAGVATPILAGVASALERLGAGLS
jgi:serine/threonine-protein kinase HipA